MRYLLKTKDKEGNLTLIGSHVLEPMLHPRLPEKWMHDPAVTVHNSHGLFNYTIKDVESFMHAVENHSCIAWEIFQVDGDKHIGRVTLQSINWIYRSAELAIVIGEPDCHRAGVGTAVVAKVLEHAKDKLGLHRVWTGTAATNKGMQRVCEKNGFKLEGTFKDGMFLNGQFVDVLAYGKIL